MLSFRYFPFVRRFQQFLFRPIFLWWPRNLYHKVLSIETPLAIDYVCLSMKGNHHLQLSYLCWEPPFDIFLPFDLDNRIIGSEGSSLGLCIMFISKKSSRILSYRLLLPTFLKSANCRSKVTFTTFKISNRHLHGASRVFLPHDHNMFSKRVSICSWYKYGSRRILVKTYLKLISKRSI